MRDKFPPNAKQQLRQQAAKPKVEPTTNADTADDMALFRQSVKVEKRIHADTVAPPQPRHSVTGAKRGITATGALTQHKRAASEQRNHEFFFSDDFEAVLSYTPLKYLAPNVDAYLLKQLRRGDFAPELLLDLHGYTQRQAKREIAALLLAAEQERVACVGLMHGHGEGVLKQRIPHWLVQHPRVLAFHQAPKEFGGDAAILVLLQVED